MIIPSSCCYQKRRPKNVRTYHLTLFRARFSLLPMLVKLNTADRPDV